ncbi:NAD(P)-binding protein, partial [Hymenopellis radicata]
STTMNSKSTIFLAGIPALFLLRQLWRYARTPARLSRISQSEERVLVLGAGTGIGRETARQYVERGARVCIVGRRQEKLNETAEMCTAKSGNADRLLSVAADIASIDDMIALRDTLQNEWNGLDTLILTAGVSALQPILGIAGIEHPEIAKQLPDINREGVQKAVSATEAATRINYYGPLVVAVTFIPLLTRSSASPSILLVSSLGAVIPCPTRALYGSTKAASLVLYQALSVEHPSIAFSCILPATVEGSFRSSAVDADATGLNENQSGLKVSKVAKRCIEAVDNRERTVFLPASQAIAPFLYSFWPTLVDRITRKKYRYYPRI